MLNNAVIYLKLKFNLESCIFICLNPIVLKLIHLANHQERWSPEVYHSTSDQHIDRNLWLRNLTLAQSS